jgi:2-amino-4-hydroxy-6-hydroxymethyldihydropteridine diphosphokinase
VSVPGKQAAGVVRSAIGIGSNLGNPVANVTRAFTELAKLGAVVARSSLYRSEPWGVLDQPPFVNAAVLLETSLPPRELLRKLKAIERNLGRRATVRWGPRVIDLDILTYGSLTIREAGLIVPHERLFERAFALGPLAEIDPAFAPAFAALPADARRGLERIGT